MTANSEAAAGEATAERLDPAPAVARLSRQVPPDCDARTWEEVLDLAPGLIREASVWRFARADRPGGYLLAALPETLREDIEVALTVDPARGYLLHLAASEALAALVKTFVPEASDLGCAPLIPPPRSVERALDRLGFSWREPGGLGVAYAVFTPMPFAGGCGVCMLAEDCPKKRGRTEENQNQ